MRSVTYTPLTATCLLVSFQEAVPFLQNQQKMLQILPNTWAASPDPGHFLSPEGRDKNTTQSKTPLGGRTRYTIAFACNKYLPTGCAALSESFSTWRERVAMTLGVVRRGCAVHKSRAQSQWPLENLSPPSLSSSDPPWGFLTLK